MIISLLHHVDLIEEQLCVAVRLYTSKSKRGGIDWSGVSQHLGGQISNLECKNHWYKMLKKDDTQKRTHWTGTFSIY
jgi:hypothetical protein